MVKRVYFVGIKGVGMTALSLIAKEAGFEVRGSDVEEEFLTDTILENNGINIDKGFDASFLEAYTKGAPDEILVVTTAAHDGLDNPQSRYAEKNGIQILTHGQAVGVFMDGNFLHRKFEGISILGCHGKTTITAMMANALSNTGLDPTYAVGSSEVFPLGNPGHLGKGEYFVAEADEFISDVNHDRTVKFLYQHPKYAVINNIDFDHPDVYKNLEEVQAIFAKFARENISNNGALIINGDDPSTHLIIKEAKCKVVTYGEKSLNNIQISNFKEVGWGSKFEVAKNGSTLGEFELSVPGYHNAKNVLSVIALLDHVGVNMEKIKNAVKSFMGTKRRQERVGESRNGAIVIDDYAHHPDEIEKTLEAIKKAFPQRMVAVVFQPHTLSRTESLQNEFAKAFKNADRVVFLPIFTSKREGETDYSALYERIRTNMEKEGKKVYFPEDTRSKDELEFSPYFYTQNRIPVVKYLTQNFDSKDWVIVTLGAGDLYQIAYDLCAS